MPAKMKTGKLVYQLKVTLKDISPPIWRRVQVTGDITLYKLHRILQTVMGWHDEHLHEFEVQGEFYGDAEINEGDLLDEKSVLLRRVIADRGDKFHYMYDLGDCWEHEILAEEILPVEKGARYPVCLKGERACPPENCGGGPGYENLLEILKDPLHPEHDQMFAWLPGDFDTEKFDVEDVNRRLRPAGGKQRKTWV